MDKAGKKSWTFMPKSPLSLANYDVGFLTSVSEQIQQGKGLTDRQATLAEKIIATYARQLTKQGIDQPDQKLYKLGQRVVDRSSSLTRKDDKLMLRFPFNEKMINDVKTFVQEAQGSIQWSQDERAWCSAITEFNVSWLVGYSNANRIFVSPDVQVLFDAILEVEKTPFAIQLKFSADKKLYIENAPDSMREYIEANIGFDNAMALIDSAGPLGYTISDEISEIVKANESPEFLKLCQGKVIDFANDANKYTVGKVVEWAIAVNRLPIVVYNPNFLTPDTTLYEQFFDPSEISLINLKTPESAIDYSAKVIYTNKVLTDWEGRLPLLVSYANLMHSVGKKDFMNKAEKIVYLCAPLPRR
jgi:hypothetical protein